MKNFLLALMVVLTTCTLAIAQNNTTVVQDSVGNVKISVKKSSKANANNTAVTVVGVDAMDADSTDIDADSSSVSHGSASFSINTDDDDFPFYDFGNAVSGLLIPIIAIISVFGSPVLILFIVFFFRYKNRKARYRLAEQALATGQPLPADFIRENKPADPCSQGIKNTFTGIGLFIFLWAITGEFGIGTIGLLVAFMGIGQWIIGNKQKQNPEASDAWMRNINKSENQNDNIKTDSSNIFSPESENKGNGLNEEKPEEEK
ncbi:DUF6249 domain-containing protein [Bacteroides congonensis]|uniref:DUF6249 domain-containing protein n=1 Tax=Bacteroides congonensis TaxID=1871006 RepID=UPI0026758749|nr:DUF6249 domain-containing protein [Bacteroides congonensis]